MTPFECHVNIHNECLLHFYGTVNNTNRKTENFNRNVLFWQPNTKYGEYLLLKSIVGAKNDISKQSKQK